MNGIWEPITAGIVVSLINKYIINKLPNCHTYEKEEIESDSEHDHISSTTAVIHHH